jgi:hypothetical protein
VNGGWPPLLCFCNGSQKPRARSVKTGGAGGDPLPCAERGKKIGFYLKIRKIFFIFRKNFKTLLGDSLELQSWLSC